VRAGSFSLNPETNVRPAGKDAMDLKLYNTLTRSKEPFRPIDPARVRMYVCGPTVYDFAHIGNARPVIVFDVLFRLLRHIYGPDHVKYVRNITDVDDKINARAAERGISIRELTGQTYAEFKADVAALGCLPPSVEPRATEHIEEMKLLIERLRAADYAYVAEDHVLFHVAAMKDYGRLSNRTLDEMMAGARVDVAPYKRDPMDFVLWKPSKAGEPAWPSPLGIQTPGRPGWHIECSAMADHWLWTKEQPNLTAAGLSRPHQFDIHGGGIDLVFPHHENELAQSRCAFHTGVMANVWMHNGFLQVEGEKMSKSLGNFITIRQQLDDERLEKDAPEVLFRLNPEQDLAIRKKQRQHLVGAAIRLNMLSTQYRQPLNWTHERLVESLRTISKWYEAMCGMGMQLHVHGAEHYRKMQHTKPPEDFVAILADDLNTPFAISKLHSLVNEPWKLFGALDLLGLIDDEIIASRKSIAERKSKLRDDPKIAALVEARLAARKAKNFAESDRIRDELKAMGVVLKDNKDGTTSWEVAR
jgi:cysteinyl-tRNA synthetase